MVAVEDWVEVGERVRAARTASDLTQGDLARRIRIDRTAMVRIEAGERGVSALELSRLAQALDIPVSHFLNRSPGPLAAYRSAMAQAPAGSSEIAADRTRFFLDVELEKHGRDAEWLREQGLLVPAPVLGDSVVAERNDAVRLAQLARQRIGNIRAPIDSMAETAELLGLYVKVVPRSTAGASLQIEPGFGVAVIGVESDPGRRRATAAHELGHHLYGDKYNSDAGVSAADQQREQLVDHFVSEFLLPADVLIARVRSADTDEDRRAALVTLSGEFRLSWSATVVAARRLGEIDAATARRLRAAIPGRGDFMAVLGAEPRPDLLEDSTGPRWRRAAIRAWRTHLVTADRAVDLLNGALTIDELPDPLPDGTAV